MYIINVYKYVIYRVYLGFAGGLRLGSRHRPEMAFTSVPGRPGKSSTTMGGASLVIGFK